MFCHWLWCNLVSPQRVSLSYWTRRSCVCSPTTRGSYWVNVTSLTPHSSGRGWTEPDWSTVSLLCVCGPIRAPAYPATPAWSIWSPVAWLRHGNATAWRERSDWLTRRCTWRNRGPAWRWGKSRTLQTGADMRWTQEGTRWYHLYVLRQVRDDGSIAGLMLTKKTKTYNSKLLYSFKG